MSTPLDRRSRKRHATRQGISDAATRLFVERGFDAVTIDEIAAAADVGRMTVFNHFPHKEDMFFDRDAQGRAELDIALRHRDPRVSPLETLRLLAHRLARQANPVVRFFDGSRRFVETVELSETLKARARAIRDELAQEMAVALAAGAGRPPTDPDAHLAAALLLASWAAALIQAHRAYAATEDPEAAKAVFLALIDKGAAGVAAAMADTPYA